MQTIGFFILREDFIFFTLNSSWKFFKTYFFTPKSPSSPIPPPSSPLGFLLIFQIKSPYLGSSKVFATLLPLKRHLLSAKINMLNLPDYITMHFLIFTQPGVFSSLLIFFNLYCRISLTNV